MGKRFGNPLIPIFITVFLDMLGLSIVIPVIPAVFFDGDSTFFLTEVTQKTRSIYYGFLIAAFPIMQFFGAPILGALSDRYGRKPLLQISQVGAFLGYLIFALALGWHSLLVLFIARLIPGFMGGNIAIVYSAVADITEPKDKAKNFGLVGAAFGLGFILGPALGGFLADANIVSWFSHSTPFYFTAALTLVNIFLVQILFPETLKQKSRTKISMFSGFRNIRKSFASPNLRKVFLVVLLLSLGFTFFTQFFSVLLFEKFKWSESNIGLLYGWVGIWLVLTQGLIVRKMSGKIAPKAILPFSIFALAVSLFLLILPDKGWWFFVINPLIALSHGITSPNMTSIVSESASIKEQGEIMGINQSMNSVGQAIPPLIAGYLNALNGMFPILAGSLLIFVAWLVFQFGLGKK
ncbi:MAG: MFS transporter [Saprospiraceae bacterium]|nr:MFS transporter [Saprospiraceae bacterium]